ncbi:MAG TPA: adenylate cyclase regulatory domain-containing protein [Solirubrobacteraceae bacterium]|nr:adenylate cyclase regulatory domain-containing protein [Solirubrobacteraceae bacterium]
MPTCYEGAVGDFDRLLDGLDGEARDARERLLRRLRDSGVSDEELARAVEEDRLVLLPVERVLHGDAKYTLAEMVEQCGVDAGTVEAVRRAAGLPGVPEGAVEFSEEDVEASKRLKSVLDAGLPVEGLVDINRVMGRALSQIAAATRQLVGETVLEGARNEDEAAERLAAMARTLLPNMGPTLEHFFARHLLEIIRTDVLGAEQIAAGTIGGAFETTVAFADLVGFTRLGGRVAPEDLGAVARKLEALASEAVAPGVRIVKTIGDAVMLTGSQPEAVVHSVLTLSDAVDAEGEQFPQVRCGGAFGPAAERDADLYGHAVNLASRVTGIARPGSVLTTGEVREAADDGFRWSFAGERKVKGVGPVKLFRARRPQPASG